MLLNGVTIATITWARTDEEQQTLRASMQVLSRIGCPIFVADGGSGSDFRAYLRSLPNVNPVPSERAGVIGQTRASLRAALSTGCSFVVYTESDKQHFFEVSLRAFIERAPDDERLGVFIAARNTASFATFPETQQKTEGAMNDLFGREVEQAGDFCYGPLIINAGLVLYLEEVDPELGWGWRFYLMALAHRAGYRLELLEADLPCPLRQRQNFASERTRRMLQLSQNLRGTVLGLQTQHTIFSGVR